MKHRRSALLAVLFFVVYLFYCLVIAPPVHGEPGGPTVSSDFNAGPRVISVSNAAASVLVEAQQLLVYPNDQRKIHVEIDIGQQIPVRTTSVIILLRSPILVTGDGANGECSQQVNERSGSIDWMVCQLPDPAPGSHITLDFTMSRPVGIVTEPIDAACRTPFAVGTPITVSINGEHMVDQATVWSPYQAGYCQYFPTLFQ